MTLDCEWARIYQRLLTRLAIYDERVKDYRSKLKVFGRIAGQMSALIFAFLKTDQETLSKVSPGQEPPPPMLYDPEVHRKHQEGLSLVEARYSAEDFPSQDEGTGGPVSWSRPSGPHVLVFANVRHAH